MKGLTEVSRGVGSPCLGPRRKAQWASSDGDPGASQKQEPGQAARKGPGRDPPSPNPGPAPALQAIPHHPAEAALTALPREGLTPSRG